MDAKLNQQSGAMTKETNSIVSSTPSMLSSSASTAAVPTTVITSAKSTVLPFPFRHDPSPTPVITPQQTDNPNLVSLLSSTCDQPSPLSSSVSTQSSNSLQSILLAKDSPSPKSPEFPLSVRASASPTATSGATGEQQQQEHSFPLAEKCQSFFLSSGIHPPTGILPSCPTQSNVLAPKSTSHSNCMIYKGYKKLCNAQSLFKCKSGSSSHLSESSQHHFNPNHPFRSPPEGDMPAAASSNSSSTSSSSTCILGDLLRSGCNKVQSCNSKKNLPLAPAEADNNNNNDASLLLEMSTHHDRVLAPNGAANAATMAAIMAASMDDEPNVPVAGEGGQTKECGNLAYYSQLLKKRIKKLYDSDSTPPGQAANKGEYQQAEEPIISQANQSAESVSANNNRKSVISKLGVYPQSHLQQARSLCSSIADFGYKAPFCTGAASVPSSTLGPSPAAAINTGLSHRSVNSYLDSLIRNNVIREQVLGGTKPTTVNNTPSETLASSTANNVITTLNSAVITTAADINPNKPHHFVNLIDKIISNVFTMTTASSTSTTTCFLSPTSSNTLANQQPGPSPPPPASLFAVLSSPDRSDASLPQQNRAEQSSASFIGLAPPASTPPRPNSNVSAITQLLNSEGSPPASPPSRPVSPCQNQPERPSPKPSPMPSSKTQSMECLNDISDKVYQQLIEFEFNHESILKKFQSNPNSDSFSQAIGRPGLNPQESARILELEKVLYPLQFCLSSMCEQRAILKKNLHKSFFEKNSNVSVDFQRQTLLATTEQAINLLIELTKQLESFSELSSSDQMNLLRTSVMEIMLMRSILILPQRLKEKMTSLKRCLDENALNETNSTNAQSAPSSSSCLKESCDKFHQNLNDPGNLFTFYMAKLNKSPFADDNTDNESKVEKEELPGKEQMEPCTSHPHDRPFGVDLSGRLDELVSSDEIADESSHDSYFEDTFSTLGSSESMAADYAKQFRAHYIKLARSIDKDWYEDRTIFYLLFAILLFRPTKSNIVGVEKVREEHLTYVYLLKRYLESKFKSYCTARSHFIRIFDRLEELQKMNDQVIQKLLDFDLVCAQNLLEKLCIC